MKKTIQHISLLLAVLLTAGLSSCIKDDYADTSKDTATVNLVFDTRADNNGDGLGDNNGDGLGDDALAGEGIKTLRVIIVDTDKDIVDVNELRDFSNETPQPVLQKTLTILALPAGNKEFYVIANEASVGLTGLDKPAAGEDFGETEKAALLGKVIDDQQRTYFPATATEIEAKGLPIAGMATKEITGTEDQTINIPITRAVAKMELTLTNNTGEAFALNQISFGKFFADQTRLFPDQATLTPGYEAKAFNPNATLAADGEGKTQTFTYYFYESSAGSDAYTIALNDGSDYAAAPIMVDGTPLASIARNTQLKVTGTIESLLEPVVTNLQLVVIPWDGKEITVPPFE